MYNPPPRQHPQGRSARVSDIWYLSYDVPNSSPVAGHGPVRQEIEVHVHPGASSFRLANMRSTANRHSRPPTRRNDYGRSWPWTRTGQQWDESIIEISAERSTLQENNHAAIASPSRAPASPPASDEARRTDTATGRPTRNMVVNLTTAEDSPSYRQFLARIAADERNTRAVITNRRGEQPATARPAEDRSANARFFEYVQSQSLSHTNDIRQESATTQQLITSDTNNSDSAAHSAPRPWNDHSPPIMRQRASNTLEIRPDEARRNSQSIEIPSVPPSLSPAVEQPDIEQGTQPNEAGDFVSSNLIYPGPGFEIQFELSEILPSEVLTLIAADPDIETRSVYDDIAWILEEEVPHLRDYRYRLLPDGTVGVRHPPAVVEEIDRRRAGNGDSVEAADTAQGDVRQAAAADVLAARLALPAEVELPPPAFIHLGSAGDMSTADTISAIEYEVTRSLRQSLELSAGADERLSARATTGECFCPLSNFIIPSTYSGVYTP